RLVSAPIEQPGIYRVSQGGKLRGTFAVNPDPREFDVATTPERQLVAAFPAGRAELLRPGADLSRRGGGGGSAGAAAGGVRGVGPGVPGRRDGGGALGYNGPGEGCETCGVIRGSAAPPSVARSRCWRSASPFRRTPIGRRAPVSSGSAGTSTRRPSACASWGRGSRPASTTPPPAPRGGCSESAGARAPATARLTGRSRFAPRTTRSA